ncbi:hypothetical protein SAMN02745664_105104 [Moraxella cuniculi DSM 21768]|uniref:DUF1315 domain-containing protein n=2 Tax=Moraxella cuniculi TaxID=34061 RepID=A0A1N7EK51_9GAMM|nr:DUF1315 family protein [Moraxella cuniculi]OOS07216.1 hypothetical protein B0189_03370 [Moraxella cuniculi]SIR88462.1 hypothetical protein SAMN02745664_105104 [Moraxella cuniculi DSM 21768]VEG13706.1 Protein of uncharacterised function (DUF1315) [Moraxella cuniculi]
MNKQDILNSLTPEIVEKFRTAIEIGRWENGERLTDAQRATCMQAVMVWEHEYLPVSERTGYIHRPVKDDGTVAGEACDVEHDHHYPHQEQVVVFKN